MTIVNAAASVDSSIAKAGIMPSLFYGRAVEAVSGHDIDPTRPRGYRRPMKGSTAVRPGAYSPRVDRVRAFPTAPSTVGTTMVIGGIEALKERNALYGVAGSRRPYAAHAPRRAGLSGTVPLSSTPAYGVVETAFAKTGVPYLYSKFAAPAGYVPNGMTRFDPVPAYTYVPLGSIVRAPSPVGCLPGTPGCYASPSGAIDPGIRKPWWMTQNEGQAYSPIFRKSDSPLPALPSSTESPLSHDSGAQIDLPINAPGMVHSIDPTGAASYLAAPGYPNTSSPWGYKGASRTTQDGPVPSGHDAPWNALEARSERGRKAAVVFFLGAAAFAIVVSRKRR